METKYGIISDIHRVHPDGVINAMSVLKSKGAQKIILNGDITGDQFPGLSEDDYLVYVLTAAGTSGLEVYVQPGSHEKVARFEPVVRTLASRHSNIIYTLAERKIELPDHHLVFLPGSDWMAGDAMGQGYHFEKGDFKTGFYRTDAGHTLMANTEDLKRYVTDPQKTIVVCHVPRKFHNPDDAVDMAYFGESVKNFKLDGRPVEAGSVFPGPVGERLVQMGAPVLMKRENRGNEDLESLYEGLGITKSVSGHFHESVHRANDRNGRHVEPRAFANELFWNASYMDGMKAGILTVKDGRVAYENVDLV
ncbi:MAG: metallophosphoesterase [Candidatus Aenigmarchaeota archaeon]|nr:metallophosphoesterase [Candidatus Aenigmarchaeota archaeon]